MLLYFFQVFEGRFNNLGAVTQERTKRKKLQNCGRRNANALPKTEKRAKLCKWDISSYLFSDNLEGKEVHNYL